MELWVASRPVVVPGSLAAANAVRESAKGEGGLAHERLYALRGLNNAGSVARNARGVGLSTYSGMSGSAL